MKNTFYDLNSKAVIKNRLRMCLGGNPVIMWNENYDGFYLKTIFILIPKSPIPLSSCDSVEDY